MEYTCNICSIETSTESSYLHNYDVDLEEIGYCESCANEIAYCSEHDGYTFDWHDIDSIKECNMCKECAGNWFSGPQSDDPDFHDSFDPDRPAP